MTSPTRTLGVCCLAVLAVGSSGVAAQRSRPAAPQSAAWSGTYELDDTRGDDVQRVAESATQALARGQRDRVYQGLISRLEAPQTISLSRDGTAVSIASSRGPRADFEADGQTRRERALDGTMVNTRAAIAGSRLTISSTGGRRNTDVLLTFDVLNNGAGLLVTRRVDDASLSEPVSVQSYYRRTSTRPSWNLSEEPGAYDTTLDVPGGTPILATLDTPISMRTSRDGDPVTMTVRSPANLRGAKIDATVARRDGGTNGDLGVDFQTIYLRSQSVDFDAVLDTITLSDGRRIHVSDDGGIPDESRSTRGMITSGAVGAAVGAIIGAVAGGGKGAAIGAAIGGAGGVIVGRGHEQLEMPAGTEMSLTSATRTRIP